MPCGYSKITGLPLRTRLGSKASDETKKKMSLAHKGMKKPWSKGWEKGKKHSIETRKKISLALKGKNIGNTWGFKKGQISYMKGKKMSPESRLKMSIAHKKLIGSLSPRWKGDLVNKHVRIRNSQEYKLWRKAVYERDNYTCIWCGDNRGGNLEADHIKPFSLYPELRFAIDNGRTLCKDCHKKTDTWGYKTLKVTRLKI